VRTIDRLLAVLDNENVEHALDRLKRRSVLRIVASQPYGFFAQGFLLPNWESPQP
jgi:hypothetical protein